MPDIPDLTRAQRQFIERVGLYFEQYHLSRIGGRLLGLLLLTAEPLGLEEMATALGVSRASVSTNSRHLVDYGLAEHVSLPGDRRDYYRLGDNAWERALNTEIDATRALRRLAGEGLAATPDEARARAHLEELCEWCDFWIEGLFGMLARWQERQRATCDVRVLSDER
ncbi:MAG TPA: hypothetical protein VFW96_03715 [Thermomicrobiales bacterium]|nr:hypothetical protein [Thermomicrobiales bacterium]